MVTAYVVLVLACLFAGCFASQLISEDRLSNCALTPNVPCVNARIANWVQPNLVGPALPAPCVESADGSAVLVSDYRGVTVRPVDDMPTLDVDVAMPCPARVLAASTSSGKYYWTYNSAVFGFPDVGVCYCEDANDCTRTVLFNSSSGFSRLSPTPPLTIYYAPNQNSVDSDHMDLPIVLQECSGDPSTWYWLNQALIDNPDSILFRTGAGECQLDFLQGLPKTFSSIGYKYYMIGTPGIPGYRSLDTQTVPDDMLIFVLEQTDTLSLIAEIEANHTVTMSFGPSFRTTVSAGATSAPAGLTSLNPQTSATASDVSQFKVASALFAEESVGGRPDVFWASGTEGLPKVLRIDLTDPANPVYASFEFNGPAAYESLDASFCPSYNASFMPWRGTGDFPSGCLMLFAANASFVQVWSQAAITLNQNNIAMFREGSDTFAILSAYLDSACPSCYLGNGTTSEVVDLWNVTDTPVLLDRLTYSQEAERPRSVMWYNGFMYYSFRDSMSTIHYFPVSSTSGFSNIGQTASFVDSNIPADAVVFSRRLYQDKIATAFGKSGTVFYNIEADGSLSLNTTIPSNIDPSGDPESGALINCGTINFIQNNGLKAANAGAGGLYDYVDIQTYDVFATPATPSPTSQATPSTTPTPTRPVASANPTPAATTNPGCILPDSCKYDCSVIEPTKFPKPSVEPSKVPEPSRVPEPKFFVLKLTYESDAADCGPDCCTVRDLLGDDAVAASFYMCSEDSTTKNRAPEYDSGAGTCSIFLAAQEGTDSGEISEAQFDALVTTLEGNAATLCPTNAKNCEVSTQKGKTAEYIIAGAGSVVASLVLVIAALAALL